MTFVWPAALLGLVAIPIGVAMYLRISRRPSRYAVSYANLDVLASVAPGSRRGSMPVTLFAVSTAVMLLAVARPQARVLVPREDATVVLVMDRSGSMSADDVEPTRLGAARASAKAFTRIVPARFRIGLVAFSDVPDVLRTPTTDRGPIVRALETLEATGGTAIGDAILESVRLIQQYGGSNGNGRGLLSAILLLSDGASTSGSDPLRAAQRASSIGIPVFTIALGTSPSSSPVTTAPDVHVLRAIARMTGAASFSAPTRDDLTEIYRDLGSRLGFEWRREEITAALAVIAGVLLVASVVSALRRRAPLP